MNHRMRTCTLLTITACGGLACGDDGGDGSNTGTPQVTTVSDSSPTSTSSAADTTDPQIPTTSSSDTTAGPLPPTSEPLPTTAPTTTTDPVLTTAPTTTDADPSTSSSPACAQGTVVCDGDTAKVCDGSGGFDSETPCPETCAQGLGCVACVPGTFACDGDVVQTCDEGGGYVDGPACDPELGLACDPELGACAGACAELGDLSYIGCEYYPVITAQVDIFATMDKPFAIGVANTAAATATVTITREGMQPIVQDVLADTVEVIELPWVDALYKGTGPTTIASGGAYHLKSTQPVTVYQYNPLNPDISNDASLLLPVNTWRADYLVASWQFWVLGSNPAIKDPGIYSVTASQDGTTVTVTPPNGGTPTQAGAGIDATGHGQVVLDAGDVLQVFVAQNGDATGTIVAADKPVQVLGGHECTEVPVGTNACDHLEESMFPIEALAKEYYVVPPVQEINNVISQKPVVVRVIASEPNTTLTFQPDQAVPKVLVDAGDFVEVKQTTQRFVVKADKKILVAEYMVGQGGNPASSDPAMVLAVPREQFRDNYRFFAHTGWKTNFVDIIAPTGTSVQVDGNNVPGFVAIGATGYGHASYKLSNAGDGTHSLTADNPVGITVYGGQNFGSYWYPGGLDLTLIAQ